MPDLISSPPDPAAYFEARFRWRFHDPNLLKIAVTHRSYTHEHTEPDIANNERLEFLGDAILDFLVANWLYVQLPDYQEGKLSRLRSALVRTEALAALAIDLELGTLLRLGVGEEVSGGRSRARTLAGTFEAVCGALFLDQGIEAVKNFALPLFTPSLARTLAEQSDKDAKSRLQEWTYRTLNQPPEYTVLALDGPEHQPHYTVSVAVDGKTVGKGEGSSKRTAEQVAAREALQALAIPTGDGDDPVVP